jgi:hypothetical protein
MKLIWRTHLFVLPKNLLAYSHALKQEWRLLGCYAVWLL